MSSAAASSLVGRDDVRREFDAIMAPAAERRILLVSGASGMGKSYVVDWLRRNRCGDAPNARLLLAPGLSEGDILSQLAGGLDRRAGESFSAAMTTVRERWKARPLQPIHLTQEARGTLGGSVSDVQQTFVYNASDTDVQMRAERMDALERALAPLGRRPFVVFVDEAEHLEDPKLRRFVVDELVARLRTHFPEIRLYFTGQSVPDDEFAPHEARSVELEAFTREVTAGVLHGVGVGAPEVQRRLFELTGGHPLLFAMTLDAIRRQGRPPTPEELDDLIATPDEARRTQRIYDKVAHDFGGEAARSAVEHLPLFEWFDRGILRAVFGEGISADDFEQIVQRSFVKRLPGGRWRCHDIIRRHLSEHLRGTDPDACADMGRRAADAFVSRLELEETRAGTRFFTGRLAIATAAFDAALHHSLPRAERMLVDEVVPAVSEAATDFLFGLSRDVERRTDAPGVLRLAGDIRVFLESYIVRHFDRRFADFLLRMAAAAATRGDGARRANLLGAAARVLTRLGDHAGARDAADEAVAADASQGSALLRVDVLLGCGDVEAAASALDLAKDGFGDSGELRIAEAAVARATRDSAAVVRILTDTVAAFPGSATEALLALAQHLAASGDDEGALVQARAVLERDPRNDAAREIEAATLMRRGTVRTAADSLLSSGALISKALDEAAQANALVSEPARRALVLAALEHDPASADLATSLALCDSMAVAGDIAGVDRIAGLLAARWPETAPICEAKRGVARFSAGTLAEVPGILQPLVDRGVRYVDVYPCLATCYAQLGEHERTRSTLARGIQVIPPLRDMFEAQVAASLARDRGPDAALDHLDALEREGVAGPHCLVAKANVYVGAKRLDDAEAILERLIHTDAAAGLPELGLVSVRILYSAVLLHSGRREKSLEVLDSIPVLFPDNQFALSQTGQALARLGEEARLAKLVDRRRGIRDGTFAILAGALAELIASRATGVEELFDRLRLEPHRIEIAVAIDAWITSRGLFDRAATVVQEIEKIAPGTVDAMQRVSQTAIDVAGGRIVSECMERLHRNPNDTSARFAAAGVLARRGSLDEAISVLGPLRGTSAAGDAVVDAFEANEYVKADRYADAERVLAPYLADRLPPPRELLGPLAAVLKHRGSPGEQIEFLRRVEATFPEMRLDITEAIADILLADSRPADAIAVIRPVADAGAMPAGLVVSQARALAGLGRSDDALAALATARARAEVAPRDRTMLLCESGRLQWEAQRAEESIADYLAAGEASPDAALPRRRLAEVYEQTGRPDLAYDALTEAIGLNPALAGANAAMLQRLHAARAAQRPA